MWIYRILCFLPQNMKHLSTFDNFFVLSICKNQKIICQFDCFLYVKCDIYKWSMALDLIFEGLVKVCIFVYTFSMWHQTIKPTVFHVARICYRFLAASYENIYLQVFWVLLRNLNIFYLKCCCTGNFFYSF